MTSRAPLQRRNYLKHSSRNPVQRWLLLRFHQALAELVALSLGERPASVLEVGCGEGFVLEFLRGRMPHLQLQALDADEVALSLARGRSGGIPLYLADAAHLPFLDRSFDLVLCLEVLEHLEEPLPALVELARVSRQGVIISVPHQPFFALANLLRGKNLRTLGDDPEHRQRWGGGRFLAFLSQMLQIRRVLYPFPWVLALGMGIDSH